MTAKLGLTFPILSDPDRVAIDAYGLIDARRNIAIPASFVIDRAGVIRLAYIGDNPRDRPTADALISAIPEQDASTHKQP